MSKGEHFCQTNCLEQFFSTGTFKIGLQVADLGQKLQTMANPPRPNATKNFKSYFANYFVFCYTKNQCLKYFYSTIHTMKEICAKDDFYFSLIFRMIFYSNGIFKNLLFSVKKSILQRNFALQFALQHWAQHNIILKYNCRKKFYFVFPGAYGQINHFGFRIFSEDKD